MNQSVMCPWTSTAPLGALKTSAEMLEPNRSEDMRVDDDGQMKTPPVSDEKKSTSEVVNVKPSSSQFFHFLRLMQLFPNVHPATLHTVMSLCKNDFFVAVDKLLYAKRCKELYQNRMQLLQNMSTPGKSAPQRFAPYSCNTSYCQNVGCIKPQVIKLDAKRMVSRSRYNKVGADKQGCSSSSTPPDLTPVNLQCNVPIRPLSPASSEDLSASTSNIMNDSLQK